MYEIPKDIKVVAEHDEYVVDARSIFGLLSLNLSDAIILKFSSKSDIEFDEEYVLKLVYPWVSEE